MSGMDLFMIIMWCFCIFFWRLKAPVPVYCSCMEKHNQHILEFFFNFVFHRSTSHGFGTVFGMVCKWFWNFIFGWTIPFHLSASSCILSVLFLSISFSFIVIFSLSVALFTVGQSGLCAKSSNLFLCCISPGLYLNMKSFLSHTACLFNVIWQSFDLLDFRTGKKRRIH